MLHMELGELDFYSDKIDQLEQLIDEQAQPYETETKKLQRIKGIAERSAETIISEIGPDMSKFPSPDHLTAFGGLAPGQKETAGKRITERKHAINLLQLMGFIRNPRLSAFYKNTGEVRLYGAQELIDICTSYDSTTTEEILDTFPLDKKNVEELCFELFLAVIHPRLLLAMPPEYGTFKKDVKNGYYKLDEKDYEKYVDAVEQMKCAARYNPKTQTYDRKKANWEGIISGLIASHVSLIQTAERCVRETLRKILMLKLSYQDSTIKTVFCHS